jgi:hypothetical protein
MHQTYGPFDPRRRRRRLPIAKDQESGDQPAARRRPRGRLRLCGPTCLGGTLRRNFGIIYFRIAMYNYPMYYHLDCQVR